MEGMLILILDAIIFWLIVSFVIVLVCLIIAPVIAARWPGWWARHIAAPCPPSLEAIF